MLTISRKQNKNFKIIFKSINNLYNIRIFMFTLLRIYLIINHSHIILYYLNEKFTFFRHYYVS